MIAAPRRLQHQSLLPQTAASPCGRKSPTGAGELARMRAAAVRARAHLLAHADHHASVAGAAHNRREHRTRGIVTGKAGLR